MLQAPRHAAQHAKLGQLPRPLSLLWYLQRQLVQPQLSQRQNRYWYQYRYQYRYGLILCSHSRPLQPPQLRQRLQRRHQFPQLWCLPPGLL